MRTALRMCLTLLAVFVFLGDAQAQSDIAFPKEVYAARRARLLAQILAQIRDALIVIPGHFSAGESGLFKQDPNFWYLTGVESPFAILVLRRTQTVIGGEVDLNTEAFLFLPDEYQFAGGQFPATDEPFRRAVWNHPRRR